jgi:hypothetical protein
MFTPFTKFECQHLKSWPAPGLLELLLRAQENINAGLELRGNTLAIWAASWGNGPMGVSTRKNARCLERTALGPDHFLDVADAAWPKLSSRATAVGVEWKEPRFQLVQGSKHSSISFSICTAENEYFYFF